MEPSGIPSSYELSSQVNIYQHHLTISNFSQKQRQASITANTNGSSNKATAMAPALPAIPLIIFGVIEPILLFWALATCLPNPSAYYISQHPSPPLLTTTLPIPPQALSLTLQITNIFLLLALLGILCSWTSHPEIAKWYLVAVAIADWGHIYSVYASVGEEIFWDLGKWNDLMWGNVGVSAVLNVCRWGTVLGVFGRVGWQENGKAKRG
jgi:hypothetical protein